MAAAASPVHNPAALPLHIKVVNETPKCNPGVPTRVIGYTALVAAVALTILAGLAIGGRFYPASPLAHVTQFLNPSYTSMVIGAAGAAWFLTLFTLVVHQCSHQEKVMERKVESEENPANSQL